MSPNQELLIDENIKNDVRAWVEKRREAELLKCMACEAGEVVNDVCNQCGARFVADPSDFIEMEGMEGL